VTNELAQRVGCAGGEIGSEIRLDTEKDAVSEAGESERNETWGKWDGGLLQSGGAKEEER